MRRSYLGQYAGVGSRLPHERADARLALDLTERRLAALLPPPLSVFVLCARDRTLAPSLDSPSDGGSGMSGGAWDANDGGRSEYPLRCDVASESARARPAPRSVISSFDAHRVPYR